MPVEKPSMIGDLSGTNLDDQIRLYINSIPELPPNTLEQDLKLGRKIYLMREAIEARAANPNIPMTENQRIKFERRMKNGKDAIEQITVPCLRMVVHVADKFHKPGFGKPFTELIELGNLGLSKAAYNYDYRKGYKFSTYAFRAIERTITSSFRKNDDIPLSHYMTTQSIITDKASRDFVAKNGHPPKDDELENITNVSEKSIRLIRAQRSMQPVSIDAELIDHENLTLADSIEDEHAHSPDLFGERAVLKKMIEKACLKGDLTGREVEVLNLIYGFNQDEICYTLEEAGKILKNVRDGKHLGRERVNQIKHSALQKLKKFINRDDVSEYL